MVHSFLSNQWKGGYVWGSKGGVHERGKEVGTQLFKKEEDKLLVVKE